MQKSMTRKGPLTHIFKLFGGRGPDAIKVGGTSRAKCGTCVLVRHLLSRGKARNRKLPPVAEVYPNPTVAVGIITQVWCYDTGVVLDGNPLG